MEKTVKPLQSRENLRKMTAGFFPSLSYTCSMKHGFLQLAAYWTYITSNSITFRDTCKMGLTSLSTSWKHLCDVRTNHYSTVTNVKTVLAFKILVLSWSVWQTKGQSQGEGQCCRCSERLLLQQACEHSTHTCIKYTAAQRDIWSNTLVQQLINRSHGLPMCLGQDRKKIQLYLLRF